MKENGTHVLSAGGAAACWQENLTRHTARLQRLQQLCKWVKPLAETQLKLRERPFWGDCLMELTHPVDQPEESKPVPTHPHREQVKRPEHAPDLDRAREPASRPAAYTRKNVWNRKSSSNQLQNKQVSPGDGPQLGERNQKVSQTLLERMAGQTLQERGYISPVRGPRGKVDRFLEKSMLPIKREMLSHQNWLHDIARRASRFLDMKGLPPPALEAQWSAGLDGEPAPPELLLRRLVASLDNAVHSIDLQMKNKAKPHQSLDVESNQPPMAPETYSPINRSTLAPLPVAGLRGDVESEWVISSGIAPPVVASSLPHLLPPQLAGEPAPALAAMIARQHARQEETIAEEDLTVLATNIKRILDEEARRHGIDV
jgi:hypothetical protein